MNLENYVLHNERGYYHALLTQYNLGGGGGGHSPLPPPNFCPRVFNFGAILLCVRDFYQKIVLHRVAINIF